MRRRIPYVPQMEISDCGAACLAMTLAYHGRAESVDRVRMITGTSRDGVNAQAMVEAARWFGLIARGVQADIDALGQLPRGSILHWGFKHFVVFDGLSRRGVTVMDPAIGRRVIPLATFRRSYTGVAIALEPGDDFKPLRRQSKRTYRYLRPISRQRGPLSRVMVTSLLMRALGLTAPLFTAVLVNRVLPQKDAHLLGVMAGAFAFIVLYNFASSWLRARLLLQFRTYLDVGLTRGLVEHLVDLPYSFFLSRSAGDLMMRMGSLTTVREILTTTTLSTLMDGVFAIGYLALLFVFSLPIALLSLFLAALQVTAILLVRTRNRRLMSQSLETTARVQGYEYQLLAGIETLKTTGAEHRAVEHWTNLFIDQINMSLAQGRLSALIEAAMGTLGLVSPMAILVLGGFSVLSGHLALGTMLGTLALATGFLGPVGSLSNTALRLQLLGSYMERVNDVLDMRKEQEDMVVRPAGRLAGRIVAENVSFAYSPLSRPVVRDVSLEVRPGQYVAIVGRSGSGKSTLANLLLGLHSPTSGRILYDGMGVDRLDVRSVRRQLGIVTQHPYLFGTSVRENIALTNPSASLEDVAAAARMACVDEDIDAMPMGYETVLSGGGASLSGGQRQRIALARALVHRPRILLLDEATSALDTVTERQIYENLARLGCTAIVIAHRMSTVANADLILVMEDGSIVERGGHDHLMELRGRYRTFVTLQSRDDP
jgi:ABC-type bacteriocin/lantibiotic exporter with double-glycine peptidase domain